MICFVTIIRNGFIYIKKVDYLTCDQRPGKKHELIVGKCTFEIKRSHVDEHMAYSAARALKPCEIPECT